VGYGTFHYCLAYVGGFLFTGHAEDVEAIENIILIGK